jgi:outer membrane protein OmpA-like peptidoglycan-associated protein
MVDEVKEPATSPFKKPEAALDGQAGPNTTPAFSKKDGQDENVQRTDPADIESVREGSEAQNAGRETVDTVPARVNEEDKKTVQYACPSISRMRIGRFQFENGQLQVTPEDAEELDKMLATASARTQQAVQKIDRQGAEAVARRFLEQNKGGMFRGGDTTANTTAPNPSDKA